MTVYYFKEDCRNVTEYYYNIILDALKKKGVKCEVLDKCTFKTVKNIHKKDYVLATTLKAFLILYITGVRNFIYWYQGITPEENYLMLQSKRRYYLYSYLEKLSLKVVRYKIGVSTFLFKHFEDKYNLKIDYNTVFIMPCFNSQLNEESFKTPGKYEKNTFCYAGGTQAWQGFDKILEIYKGLEQSRDDVFLKIYSKDIDVAKRLIEKSNIKHYSVDCVPQSQMDSALADCKFGFIIREDDIINNVATPTKLGTYLANGVIPIFSDTIYSFRELAGKYKYLGCISNEANPVVQIAKLMDEKLQCDMILQAYKEIFGTYYNKEKYITEMTVFFDEIF